MAQNSSIPNFDLNDGTTLPVVGLGTYPMKGEEAVAGTLSGIDAGYRLLDTAVNYENEDAVGEAVRRSEVPRDELLVATKIPGRDHAYDKARASIETSLKTLGLERTDLHLIHWPNPSVDLYVQAWKALVDAQRDGQVRTIGVSNFTPEHLRRIIDETGVTPAVNQVELHPFFPQTELLATHAELGIRTEAWSPLGRGGAVFEAEPVTAAAQAHGVTPGQVVLRWHLQRGVLAIPKSGNPQRQAANLDIFGFELSDAQVQAITGLGTADGRLFDADPNTHEEM